MFPAARCAPAFRLNLRDQLRDNEIYYSNIILELLSYRNLPFPALRSFVTRSRCETTKILSRKSFAFPASAAALHRGRFSVIQSVAARRARVLINLVRLRSVAGPLRSATAHAGAGLPPEDSPEPFRQRRENLYPSYRRYKSPLYLRVFSTRSHRYRTNTPA